MPFLPLLANNPVVFNGAVGMSATATISGSVVRSTSGAVNLSSSSSISVDSNIETSGAVSLSVDSILVADAIVETPTNGATPDEIEGLFGWYKADTGITLTNGVVSGWEDQSGQGNHLGQSVVGARPSLVASSDINSKPAVKYNGNALQQLISTGNTAGTVGAPFTIFVVFRRATTSANTLVHIGANAGGKQNRTDNSRLTLVRSLQAVLASGNTVIPVANNYIGVFAHEDTRVDLILNGSSDGGANIPVQNFSVGPISVGARTDRNEPWNGLIAEAICFNRRLSLSEIALIDTYLSDEYAITVADYVEGEGATQEGSVNLSVSSSLTLDDERTTDGVVNLSVDSALSSSAVRQTSSSVDLTATSSLSTSGVVTKSGSVSLSVDKELTAETGLAGGSVSLSSNKILVVSGVRSTNGIVSLNVSSTLNAQPFVLTSVSLLITSTQSLSINAAITQQGLVSLSASSNLTVNAVRIAVSAVSLSSATTISFSASIIAFATVNLVSNRTLNVGSPRVDTTASVSMSVAKTLFAAAGGFFGTVSLTSTTNLSVVTPRLTALASVSLSVASVLAAVARVGVFGAVSLQAATTLTASDTNGVGGSVSMTSVRTLVVSGVKIAISNVGLIVSYAINIAAVRQTSSSVLFSPTVTLALESSVSRNASINLLSATIIAVNGIKLTQATVVLSVVANILMTAFVGGWPPVFGPPVVSKNRIKTSNGVLKKRPVVSTGTVKSGIEIEEGE